MDHNLHSQLTYELRLLKNDRNRLQSRITGLEQYRGSYIRINTHRNGRSYYYLKRCGESSYKYVGPMDNGEIDGIREFAHVDRALSIVNDNIGLVRNILDKYRSYDFGEVDKLLPMVYRTAPSVCKTSLGGFSAPDNSAPADSDMHDWSASGSDMSRLSASALISPGYASIGHTWRNDRLEFLSKFPENYPQFKTERTSDGTWVKSKSEAALYEKLLSSGLIFIYELPLVSCDHGPNLYPDFTVLSPVDGRTEILIEYAGRLDKQQYREDFAMRIYRLMKNGYTPGVDLFFAFGDLEGHLDLLQVNKIIADIKGLR